MNDIHKTEFSEELVPDFPTCKSKVIPYVSKEDLEALKLGRKLQKKEIRKKELFEVNIEYHKHLKSEHKK